jgi:hypothetical protein
MKFGILQLVGVRAGGIGSHTGNARMDGDWCLLLKNLSVFMLAGERQED